MAHEPEPLPLLLASASPRRRELMAGMGLTFAVEVSGLEEAPWPNEVPASYALRNAYDKARAVADRRRGSPALIVSADTIVVQGRTILEKPADAADARRMLRMLSGCAHEVITGLCLLKLGAEGLGIQGEAVRTAVEFRELSDADIAAYVDTGEPMDKAGAYAIQGGAAGFVRGLRGSHSNVVGLPVEALERMLRAAGVRSFR